MLLCWLALLLVRVAERQTSTTWRRIDTEPGRLHLAAEGTGLPLSLLLTGANTNDKSGV